MQSQRYLRPRRDAKGKAAFSSDSKLALGTDWNESKNPCCTGSKCRSFFGGLPALITSASASASASAVATSTVAATSAIASVSTTINRIARTIRCGMDAAAPAELGPAVVAGITGAVRSGAVARRSARCAAVLQSRRHYEADQRRAADRDCECRHPARHRFLSRPTACRSPLAHRKSCAAAHICREMWRSRSLIIQVKCGTFALRTA
jgi:hypothetical protein